jgi:hypothetical protein
MLGICLTGFSQMLPAVFDHHAKAAESSGNCPEGRIRLGAAHAPFGQIVPLPDQWEPALAVCRSRLDAGLERGDAWRV